MKRLILTISVILGSIPHGSALEPPPLSSLSKIHALNNAQASHVLPVLFQATVTYFNGYESNLFVQDGKIAIFVQPEPGVQLKRGERVLIKGTTQPSFRPLVKADSITVLHPAPVPAPKAATFQQLLAARLDSRYVTLRGKVQTIDSVYERGVPYIQLRLSTGGGSVDVQVDTNDPTALDGLLDADVELTGVAAGRFDGKMQQTGSLIHVSSIADVRVLRRAVADPWSLPVTGMDQVMEIPRRNNIPPRVRVRGSITYYQPGAAVVLQSGGKSLWIGTQTEAPLRVGDRAEATGFPDAHDGFLTLANGEVTDKQMYVPVPPQPEDWNQLVSSRHLFDLVSIQGKVVSAVREQSQDEYVLLSDGFVYSAIYRHSGIPSDPMREIPAGSIVRVTGICVLNDANPFHKNVSFNILLRSPDDVAVVARPSWLNIRHLMMAVSLLALIVIAIGAWGWMLSRRVQEQTAELSKQIAYEATLERRMAQLEQRRSHILEAINGTDTLADILEEVTELVSLHLYSAPSWCELADGTQLGDFPADVAGLRIISQEIPARSGPALGRLFAAFANGISAGAQEQEGLSVGARLATLAIETRRLYHDLRRRSEFDLLTDIHNRFSLEKQLEALIEHGRQNGRGFGLIYIDLDEFKQVNDRFGHRMGDLYLQEVALRMKRQLRGTDTLARLGGDEFAALVPVVRNRDEVEEIAERLEQCFAESFRVGTAILQGSASFGVAIYPDDGDTKDCLFIAADAAMYRAKHSRTQDTAAAS